jgi:arylsulfatase A-like enzyme
MTRLGRIALLLVLIFAGRTSAAETTQRLPNFVVILADDLGYSDLGCYGSEIQTPHLDALAAGGLRLTNFYNTARCWPSRAALLTGYYAQQVRRDGFPGVAGGGSKGTRPDWAPLLPVALKTQGYRSYHSGKWHVDNKPIAAGFDHSYWLEDAGRNFHPRVHSEDDQRLPPVKPDSGYYSTTHITERAIAHLQDHARSHAEQPFFSYVAYIVPHFPLHAPAEDIAKYKETYRVGWDTIRANRWKKMQEIGLVAGEISAVEREVGPPYDFPEQVAKFGPSEVNRPIPWNDLTPAQQEFQASKMAIHAAMVDRMDQEIGRLLQQIRDMGQMDNTFVMFMSDNGCSAEMMVRDDGHDPAAAPGSAATHLCLGPGWSTVSNSPFRRHKTWVHEGGIATPMIVHGPGVQAPGSVRHDPGHLIDVWPTLTKLAGVAGEPTTGPTRPGVAIPLGEAITVSERELWWAHEGNRALRVGNWKITALKESPWELYDLSTDRAEQHNLAEKNPEKLKELADRWELRSREYQEHAKRP